MSTQIVEINGVKMEIDMRSAKTVRVDTLKVGTKVRILKKGYNEHQVHSGVVVGFEAFERLPSILFAYIETGYSDNPLKFLTLNAETKDVEVIAADQDETEDFNRATVVGQMNRAIEQKKLELQRAESALELFTKYYGSITDVKPEAGVAPCPLTCW